MQDNAKKINPMPTAPGGAGPRTEPRQAGAAEKRQYYEAAQAWDVDRLRYALVSRNRAYLLAAIAVVMALAAVLAVAYLAPLKTVQVAVFAYDETSGTLKRVEVDKQNQKFTSDEAFIKNQIYQFVMARETWDFADIVDRRKTLRLQMDPEVWRRYSLEFDRRNPQSMAAVLGEKGTRVVKIKVISFLDKSTTAHVQFTTETRVDAGSAQVEEWAAVVSYKFLARPENVEDLWANPFGFQVTSYRRDLVVQ